MGKLLTGHTETANPKLKIKAQLPAEEKSTDLKSSAGARCVLEIKYKQKRARCAALCCAPIRPPTLPKSHFSWSELLSPPPIFAVCHSSTRQLSKSPRLPVTQCLLSASALVCIKSDICLAEGPAQHAHNTNIPQLPSPRTALNHPHVWRDKECFGF